MPLTNIFGLDVAGFEQYLGYKSKGPEEAGAGGLITTVYSLLVTVCSPRPEWQWLRVVAGRSDDQSLDSIPDLILCEEDACEDATRGVTACEDRLLLPAAGEQL